MIEDHDFSINTWKAALYASDRLNNQLQEN